MSYKFNPFTGGLDYFDADQSVRVIYLAGEIVSVQEGRVLQLHSPVIDGELYIEGEVYIL
tara:strand:- start:186 stop:365 length:180 start_codon:yes stop_codon:yes gene_type:complete